MNNLLEYATKLKEILGLEREPVGVKFLKEKEKQNLKDNYDDVTKTRYCQALMRAGNGEKVMVTSENISCPASAAAFGVKPLPEVLASGQMLYNLGLFATPEAGKKAMEGMTRLNLGDYHAVILSPLGDMEVEPDVVVVESKPEHLMWLSLAYIYETGERLQFNSAIFQATCVDSTVIPFVTGKLNSSLGCYGCRDATNIRDEENLIGIPYKKLNSVVKNLEQLSLKPMKKARAKEAFHSLKKVWGVENIILHHHSITAPGRKGVIVNADVDIYSNCSCKKRIPIGKEKGKRIDEGRKIKGKGIMKG